MKVVICDNCGRQDDWSMRGIPFHPRGAVIRLRAKTDGEEFVNTLEICETCKEILLKQFPKLAEVLKEKQS